MRIISVRHKFGVVVIKLWIILNVFQVASIYGSSDTKSEVKANSKLIPIEESFFVNGRVNDILLIITDHKNNQFQRIIKSGDNYGCTHKPLELKKVVCYEKLAVNTTLSKTDLDTYAVFLFNTDKVEKYHFINIRQKNEALNRARDLKNEALFNEISDQTIYNP